VNDSVDSNNPANSDSAGLKKEKVFSDIHVDPTRQPTTCGPGVIVHSPRTANGKTAPRGRPQYHPVWHATPNLHRDHWLCPGERQPNECPTQQLLGTASHELIPGPSAKDTPQNLPTTSCPG
jgi:hypothetical protein